MTLDGSRKAMCRAPRDCWDCMSCVKVCPVGALETRIPYQLGYHVAKLIPMMGTDTITWTCIDLDGKVERYRYRIRGEADEE